MRGVVGGAVGGCEGGVMEGTGVVGVVVAACTEGEGLAAAVATDARCARCDDVVVGGSDDEDEESGGSERSEGSGACIDTKSSYAHNTSQHTTLANTQHQATHRLLVFWLVFWL